MAMGECLVYSIAAYSRTHRSSLQPGLRVGVHLAPSDFLSEDPKWTVACSSCRRWLHYEYWPGDIIIYYYDFGSVCFVFMHFRCERGRWSRSRNKVWNGVCIAHHVHIYFLSEWQWILTHASYTTEKYHPDPGSKPNAKQLIMVSIRQSNRCPVYFWKHDITIL